MKESKQETSAPVQRPNQNRTSHPPSYPQVKRLLEVINGEMARGELQQVLDLSDRKSFRERYLKPALDIGYVEMALPEKPSSRLQKYHLTTGGKWLWMYRSHKP